MCLRSLSAIFQTTSLALEVRSLRLVDAITEHAAGQSIHCRHSPSRIIPDKAVRHSGNRNSSARGGNPQIHPATAAPLTPDHRVFIRAKKAGDCAIAPAQVLFDLDDREALPLQVLHPFVAESSVAVKDLPSLFLGAATHVFADCRRDNRRLIVTRRRQRL